MRLPDDILFETFNHLVTLRGSFESCNDTACVNVAQVCQQRRRVALGTSRWWTRLMVKVEREGITTIPLPHHLLHRAGSLPIFLSYDISTRGSHQIQPPSGSAVALHEIKGIDITCTDSAIYYSQISSWLSGFPNLRRLALKNFGVERAYNWPASPPSYLHQLTHLHIDSDEATWFLYQVNRWENLVSLTLRCGDTLDAIILLRDFPNLIELFLRWNQDDDDEALDNIPLTHNKLRTLSICSNESLDHEGLFLYITLPNLMYLAIGNCFFGANLGLYFLYNFLERSKCCALNITLFSSEGFPPGAKNVAEQMGEEWHVSRIELVYKDADDLQIFIDSKARWYS